MNRYFHYGGAVEESSKGLIGESRFSNAAKAVQDYYFGLQVVHQDLELLEFPVAVEESVSNTLRRFAKNSLQRRDNLSSRVGGFRNGQIMKGLQAKRQRCLVKPDDFQANCAFLQHLDQSHI